MTTPTDLFNAGDLAGATAAASDRVRKAPADGSARLLLAELLLFVGNFERADRMLDALAATDPSAILAVTEFRQLLRAEVARRQVFTDGRVPDFIGGPEPAQRATLALLVALLAGDEVAAAAACLEAEAARVPAPGTTNGTGFSDWRDADDLLGGSLEVLTVSGHYYWVPFHRVVALTPVPPRRPRDLFWRRARLSVADGPEADVYLPVLYPSDPRSELQRLGRETDWLEVTPGLVRGLGQKTFIIGEDGVPVLQLAPVERHA